MKSNISFILDNRVVYIDFEQERKLTPTTTVLNYLRQLPNHKGVKEGCAEGDCGACTVVIGELENNRIRYRAVDSCLIFLPMLDGKLLVTVENLKSPEGKLHPVQEAMIEQFGSQCGFCTPGIIMSMFDLYKNYVCPSRSEIEDVLSGNLCRCTGYRPIVDAALKACSYWGYDHFTEEEGKLVELLKSINKESLIIKTQLQTYFKPSSLSEALEFRNKHPNSIILCGATDVALKVTKAHELLQEIIDLSAIEELKFIEENIHEIKIGAGVVINDVRKKIIKDFPALYEMLNVFASNQIRNFATLGGNLGTASPIGDSLPVLMAYEASVELQSIEGRRVVPLNEYFVGYRKTLRKDNELITKIIIPKQNNGAVIKSYKVSKRKDLDISTLSAGFKLESRNNIVQNIILAYGGMAERPKRASETEKFLRGKSWTREVVEKAMDILQQDFTPISDVRGSAEFRRIAARNLILKFWNDTKLVD
ncbi:MAG: Xanthine dehydrogenase iron-sulfur subunit [Ignavibacteriae bacterium]|nr:MAG: Xanthine dehydrogenase iron-sulfur subunit [Ignavibacteriota bacterium]